MSRSEEENLNCMIHLISLLRRNPILMAHVKSTTIAMSNSEIESQIKLTQFFYSFVFLSRKKSCIFSQIEICPSIVLNLKLFFYRTASIISSIFFHHPQYQQMFTLASTRKKKIFGTFWGNLKMQSSVNICVRVYVCVCLI